MRPLLLGLPRPTLALTTTACDGDNGTRYTATLGTVAVSAAITARAWECGILGCDGSAPSSRRLCEAGFEAGCD